MGRIALGIIFGLLLAPAVLLAWLRWGRPPVAVNDAPLPMERWITHIPLHTRIAREMEAIPPIQPDEKNLIEGARVYRDQCAACHGVHGKRPGFAAHMYPDAPPLWEKHEDSAVVGVSDDPPGETYWKVANGIRLTGMPAYRETLSETQIWQVSLLLANADKPLPPAAVQYVRGETPAPAASPAVTTKK